jgi:hypothetical protein
VGIGGRGINISRRAAQFYNFFLFSLLPFFTSTTAWPHGNGLLIIIFDLLRSDGVGCLFGGVMCDLFRFCF